MSNTIRSISMALVAPLMFTLFLERTTDADDEVTYTVKKGEFTFTNSDGSASASFCFPGTLVSFSTDELMLPEYGRQYFAYCLFRENSDASTLMLLGWDGKSKSVADIKLTVPEGEKVIGVCALPHFSGGDTIFALVLALGSNGTVGYLYMNPCAYGVPGALPGESIELETRITRIPTSMRRKLATPEELLRYNQSLSPSGPPSSGEGGVTSDDTTKPPAE